MEIRIYNNMDSFSRGKYFYCARIECPDAFNFSSALDVFRSIYGTDVIIVFLCV